MKKYNAFTLIEVLIALIVLAIAFTALCETTRSNISSSMALQQSLTSNWVALNVVSAIELGLLPKPQPGSDTKGQETLLNTDWQWTASTDQTTADSAHVEQVIVTVDQKGKTYHQLIGFIAP